MKYLTAVMITMLLIVIPARAQEIPGNLLNALPREVKALLDHENLLQVDSLWQGVLEIWDGLRGKVGGILSERLKGTVLVVATVLLCSALEGVGSSGIKTIDLLPLAGALSVTMLSAGSLDSLVGLGASTIDSLGVFSKALLPTLAAATASAGALSTATIQQVTTVFFVDVLVQMIKEFLLPLVYCYIGMLTAGAMLSDDRLKGIALAIKKGVTWLLCSILLLFTVYLSVVHVVAGSTDGMSVKMTKTVIAGAIPVVGGILSEASETVLVGAGMLKNTIGILGMLGIISLCGYPFLQLGVQYLLYKLAAFLSVSAGPPVLGRLIDGLAGAFGLVLGMTGACALLLLISIVASIAAVVPV